MSAPRPILLFMLSGAAALTGAVSAVGIAAPAEQGEASKTRLGAEIQDAIARRDKNAAERARTLDLQEKAIRAAQARLTASAKAQAQAQPQQAAGAAAPSAAPVPPSQEENFARLAKIYQTMKPGRAAPVFSQLDLDVQVQVARRMRERAAASLLAAMDAPSAARLSMALAGKAPARPALAEAGQKIPAK